MKIDKHDIATRLANLAYDYDYYNFMDSLDIGDDIDTVILDNEKSLNSSAFIDGALDWLYEVIENAEWVEETDGRSKYTTDFIERAKDLIADLKDLKRSMREGIREGIQKFCIEVPSCCSSNFKKCFVTKKAKNDIYNAQDLKDVLGYKGNNTLLFDSEKDAYKFIAQLVDQFFECDKKDFKVIPFFNLGGIILDSLKEDTVKQGSHWVNKGKEGTHGKFKTKKAADAQRKAMFANSGKNRNFGEGLNESFKEMIDWDGLNFEIYDKLSNYLRENPEVYFEEPTPMSNGDTQVKFEILWGGDEDGFATVDIKGKMYGNPNIIHFVGKENSQKLVMEFDCRSVKEMINNILDYIEF